ncbi:lipopolysaccharide kinase InaA family protein [Pseudomonas sp. GM17]|uniref:lipopolysaccharide kinase InaA family protein n=1 Tax=Pseudomonas sp. GM17 TaxID=1144323 RepID=UPI001EE64CDC|nr:lipopolysaccharide kinase InaA family protein [Pseudomonas sp. GM17]WIE49865.1 lipopolysaccharide kinase InaA family protein [Pseudomonas sp. GM17]
MAVLATKKQFRREFPYIVKEGNSTLHLNNTPRMRMSRALFGLICRRRLMKIKRISASVTIGSASLFVKAQALDSIKARFRVTLGISKRDGEFDWPVEELLNMVEASRRGADVPSLIGFGYKKSYLGLIEEFFIITQFLEGFIDGVQWLKRDPGQVEALIKASFGLLRTLHEKRITHMDFWVANVMLSQQCDLSTKAIDLENCFHSEPQYLSETLGFQFGFFYHREIYRFITEARYDRLVEEALCEYENLIFEKFEVFYNASKHMKIGRKERRRIFLNGILDLN